ncbi:MAG: hypothetical protein K2I64_05080 [Muribaculaceae bacterium]|nr:hypothetical protein [Muribaculaceae bacterium]
MKVKYILAAIIGLAATAVSAAPRLSVDDIVSVLSGLADYQGRATYSVLLPQAEDPVEYTVDMQSTVASGDPLSPISYLIEWKLNDSEGFSAYFDGHHYRYRNNRLQEYHFDWDSIPFVMGKGGVQLQAQFVDILPQMTGRELSRLVADSTFIYTYAPDTVYNGQKSSIIKGKVMYHGYVSKEVVYVFDPATGMIRCIEMENNPGSISEQSVSIRYSTPATEQFPLESEEDLIALYPDVFERFRENNFKVENLPGILLPTFSSPTSTGERYTYHRGDPLTNPTVILVVDESVGTTNPTLEALREAADKAPVAFDLVIAFRSNNADRAQDIVGSLRPGEHLLLGARGLARDCGVTVTPTIIYVGRDGKVADVTLGYNKALSSVVIQKIALM